LDETINISQEIERAVIFPAIEKVFQDFGVSNYSLQFEQVYSGKIDYSNTQSVIAGADESPGRLVIWGMVKPLKWPEKYDLTLILYMDSQPVYRASLNVRQGMIISWNQQNCQLPLQSLGQICGILALKIDGQKNVPKSEPDPAQMESYIESLKYKLPADVQIFLVKWKADKRVEELLQKGMLTLMLERGGTYQLQIDQSYNRQLESFLTANKTLNWFLDQSSLLMPEIEFKGTVSKEVAVGEVFSKPGSVRQTPLIVNVGIIPFDNRSEVGDADWLGFGLEYLLINKFSNIPLYKLAKRDAVTKFVRVDSVADHLDSLGWSRDFSIGGEYNLDDDLIELDISIAQAFGGVRIASEHYRIDYEKFFDVVDDVADKFIRLTDVSLTESETNRLEKRVTNSMRALEYFCLGYIEKSRSTKDMDLVIDNFKEAIDEDPTFWAAYYNLGTAYYYLGMYQEALSQFDFIIENFPSFELAYLGRGLTFLMNGDYHKALTDFLIYRDYRPLDYRGWYYAGRCAHQMKQYSKALGYLTRVVVLQPMYSRGYYELGNVYYTTRRFQLAILNYNLALDLEADLVEARRRLGESYYRKHDFKRAFSEFKKILIVSPNDAEANFMMGITVYQQAALNEYIDEFLELYGLSTKEEMAANKLKNDLKKQLIYEEIISCFHSAQIARKNFYEATFNLALTYQEVEQPDSALYYYEKTLQINPRLAKAHIVLAKFHEKQGKYNKALEEYKLAVRIDPRYFVNYPRLGLEYDEIDLVALVKKELEREVQLDPNNIPSILSLANILYAQGFRGKAAGLYRKVLALQPEEKTAKEMLAQMGE